MPKIKIEGHLIIPFGRPKWDINKIRITGVSTTATYFESDTPCVYINAKEQQAIRLRDFDGICPDETPLITDVAESVAYIKVWLTTKCDVQTESERRFLDFYFQYCMWCVTPTKWDLEHQGKKGLPAPKDDLEWIFDAFLPLPQAHLYLTDPLQDEYSFVPKNMVKVDFAFWTGKRIIAVEIDGTSHIGSEQHIRKDRMLQRAGVPVFHILNSELEEHKHKTIWKILPSSITNFWTDSKYKHRFNPLLPF